MRRNVHMARGLDNVLLAACRHDGAKYFDEVVVAPLRERTFRAAFVDHAWRHGVLGLALATLERSGSFGARPDEFVAELSEHARRLRRHAHLWVLERDRVVAALAGHGLRAVILKGAALCTTLYAAPVERQLGDIDILLARDDVEAAARALVTLGYRELRDDARTGYRDHHYHFHLRHPCGFIVELHWDLVRPSSPLRLDATRFLLDSRLVRADETVPIRVPRSEHLLLHVVVQNIEHRFDRLSRIVDLDRIVRASTRLDWGLVRQGAQTGGSGPGLALSLQLARRLLGTPIPPEHLASTHPAAWVRFHLEALRPEMSLLKQRFARHWIPGSLLAVWLQAGWRRRMRCMRRLVRSHADPLSWLWQGRRAPPPGRRRLATVLTAAVVQSSAAVVVGLYQLALYLPATAAIWWGSRDRRFWQIG